MLWLIAHLFHSWITSILGPSYLDNFVILLICSIIGFFCANTSFWEIFYVNAKKKSLTEPPYVLPLWMKIQTNWPIWVLFYPFTFAECFFCIYIIFWPYTSWQAFQLSLYLGGKKLSFLCFCKLFLTFFFVLLYYVSIHNFRKFMLQSGAIPSAFLLLIHFYPL